MKSKWILFVGLLVSLIYIISVVYFQVDKKTDKKIKYLYLKSGNNITIVSKLKNDSSTKSLLSITDEECLKYSCDRDISYGDYLYPDEEITLLKKLLLFVDKNDLSKASIIAIGNEVEISFLVGSEEQLFKLKNLYKTYQESFIIKDKSSVIKIYDVATIEDEINNMLKNGSLSVDDKNINFLNSIFRKLKVLGSVSIDIYFNTNINKNDLKKFILKNYDWVKNINLIKSKKNKIKIKEVL